MRQVDSAYAPVCRPVWKEPNGGVTSRGVTAETIAFVSRRYDDGPENTVAEQILAGGGGQAPEEEISEARRVFVDYFNQVYELYGRRVTLTDFTTRASQIDEVTGKGREQACADATEIAAERKAFGVIPADGLGLQSFSECAVGQRLFLPVGPYAFPESWYQKAHPYAWAIQMDCERIAHQVAEYVARRVAGKPARFARDPNLSRKPRVFGLVGPDSGAYQSCADMLRDDLAGFGVKIATRYDYTLDPATIPQQSTQAVVKFKEEGVTSLILFSDFFTNINLTSQARNQQWGPEWILVGAGFQDNDNYTRLYDQDRVDGHLFGLSGLGPRSGQVGPEGEPARLYKKLTGKALPPGTDGDYFNLVHLFNLLQGAGSNLTPDAIAAGAGAAASLGAPAFDVGLWSNQATPTGAPGLDHTAVDDAREVYWDGDATGWDGKKGAYVATYGGRRFGNRQWPAEDPAVYPAACPGTCGRIGAGGTPPATLRSMTTPSLPPARRPLVRWRSAPHRFG